MNANIKWLIGAIVAIVLCLVVLIAPLIAIGVLFHGAERTNRSGYGSGVGESFQTSAVVDPTLSRYINLTALEATGEGGPGYSWNTISGNVTWIDTPQDSIKSLQNIHLAVYTRLDENSSWSKNTYMLWIGIHVVANQTEQTIPTDAIDHQEIIIPALGLDMPNYPYSFNCSTFVD